MTNGYDHGWYNGDRVPPDPEPFDFAAYLTAQERAWFDLDTARRRRRWTRIAVAAAVMAIVCVSLIAGAVAAWAAVQ